MAEDVKAPAAEPSPAAIKVPHEPHAYAEWRQTGKLPKPEASATSEKQSDAGEESAEKGAPAPEAGDQQESKAKPRSNAETRLKELLDDLKRAGMSPAELKTFKREVQETKQPKAEPKVEKGPESPKKPKVDDFDTYEKYEEARDQYYEDLADYKAQQRLDQFRQEQKVEAAQQELNGKVEAARKRYGAEADSTIATTATEIFNDQKIPAAVKAVINDSPVLVDLLYVMGSKAEEFQEFLKLARSNPGAAIRKAVLVERLVSEELAKGGKSDAGAPDRDESGKFKQPPAKKVTEAPPPPREASGRGAVPPDEVESAAKANDFAAFRNAANRRDMARHKGL